MLTYDISQKGSKPLYIWLYEQIRKDIERGNLVANEKLPSKRALAEHLKISIVTVQNSYAQLIAEGYIYSIEKKGYFVADFFKNSYSQPTKNRLDPPLFIGTTDIEETKREKETDMMINLSENTVNRSEFPLSVWMRLMRNVISKNYDSFFSKIPSIGLFELRKAISDHLYRFRGISADPNQIFIGAGTEYLYSILIKLLGRTSVFAVEDPGYRRISQIYEAENVKIRYIPLDSYGLDYQSLLKTDADIVHISPSHHFPTGIIMPIGRRQEILHWAEEKKNRFIIEDDYDSEFRFQGKPLPTMESLDHNQKIIYINTFSKTISPSFRISYMILPRNLMVRYQKEFSFYACTVPSLEQYTLSEFIKNGYFERHLNRMKRKYRAKKDELLNILKESPLNDRIVISETMAGLHFTVKLKTMKSDEQLKAEAAKNGMKIKFLSDYTKEKTVSASSTLLINYTSLESDTMKKAVSILEKIL